MSKKPTKNIVSTSISDAILKTVENVVDSGYDVNELIEAVDNEPVSVISKNNFNQKDLDELVEIKSKGSAVPGQSLTNNPENPYPWERPAKFSNPREALNNILGDLLQPEATKNIVKSLQDGMSVSDISSAVVYSKFFKGDINPDVMLLVYEPVMYSIMGIGEEEGIDYNIEHNDADEIDDDDNEENLKEFRSAFEQIKNSGKVKNVAKEKINSGVLPKSLLDRIKDKGPEIKSLLNKQEEKDNG